MHRDRAHHLLSHLALALAGVCVTGAGAKFLPESWLFLPLYLLLVGGSWRVRGRWALPTWAANALALLIVGGTAAWVLARGEAVEDVLDEVPLHARLIPHLGPVL